jgi:PleD family two-component response regulator
MSSRALISGDDDLMRAMLRSALESQGYQVFETRNGQECLQQYEQVKPSLIFLDCIMPVMDGYTCCELLRQKSAAKYTPIIMLSSRDDIASVQQAFKSGVTDYILKTNLMAGHFSKDYLDD